MKYKNMLWDGFRHTADFASKWKLGAECRMELAALLQSEYNSGANDLIEYIQSHAEEPAALLKLFPQLDKGLLSAKGDEHEACLLPLSQD
jgi:hypothetical protein